MNKKILTGQSWDETTFWSWYLYWQVKAYKKKVPVFTVCTHAEGQLFKQLPESAFKKSARTKVSERRTIIKTLSKLRNMSWNSVRTYRNARRLRSNISWSTASRNKYFNTTGNVPFWICDYTLFPSLVVMSVKVTSPKPLFFAIHGYNFGLEFHISKKNGLLVAVFLCVVFCFKMTPLKGNTEDWHISKQLDASEVQFIKEQSRSWLWLIQLS